MNDVAACFSGDEIVLVETAFVGGERESDQNGDYVEPSAVYEPRQMHGLGLPHGLGRDTRDTAENCANGLQVECAGDHRGHGWQDFEAASQNRAQQCEGGNDPQPVKRRR